MDRFEELQELSDKYIDQIKTMLTTCLDDEDLKRAITNKIILMLYRIPSELLYIETLDRYDVEQWSETSDPALIDDIMQGLHNSDGFLCSDSVVCELKQLKETLENKQK